MLSTLQDDASPVIRLAVVLVHDDRSHLAGKSWGWPGSPHFRPNRDPFADGPGDNPGAMPNSPPPIESRISRRTPPLDSHCISMPQVSNTTQMEQAVGGPSANTRSRSGRTRQPPRPGHSSDSQEDTPSCQPADASEASERSRRKPGKGPADTVRNMRAARAENSRRAGRKNAWSQQVVVFAARPPSLFADVNLPHFIQFAEGTQPYMRELVHNRGSAFSAPI
ncbi:hypothetical protein GQ53DRAFT_136551 [Thozetella sp. PMI_491]|nr:hypothetical protein GQ53DRAFT_136551 [Thozetella sp. PMI_491]